LSEVLDADDIWNIAVDCCCLCCCCWLSWMSVILRLRYWITADTHRQTDIQEHIQTYRQTQT